MSACAEMQLKQLCRAAVLALVAGWAADALVAQSQPQAGPRTSSAGEAKLYRIAGKLTDAFSGQVIAGATMELATARTHLSLQTAQTGDDGQFSFDPVPQGKYSVVARRRGYYTEAFDQHEEYASAIVTGEGLDTEHIPFRLDPGGVIRGRVTDDAGEPVVGAQVAVTVLTRWGGLGERMAGVITLDTNDQGEFEGWNLLSGKYLLAVQATPWFALHPSESDLESATGDEQRAAEAALDVAYPVTYYDGTTDEKAAVPIALGIGETAEVNFSLHAVPAVHLTFRLPQNSDRGGGFAAVSQNVLGKQMVRENAISRKELDGAVALEFAVPPGSYEVVGGTPPRVTEIDATGSQEVDLSQGTPTAEGNIRVQMADGSPLPKELQIALLSVDSLQRRVTAQVDEKSTVQFASIPQGKWIAVASSKDIVLGVVATQTGGAIKAGCIIELAGQPTRMTMLLAKGETRIEGFATKNGTGEAGEMVVLVPKDPATRLTAFRRDQSDSDGSFALLNVIPGEYTIVAIEGGWDVEWARPEVIQKYVAGGVRITVPEKAGELLRLTAPVAIQER